MSEPITNVEDAVAAVGALPAPMGPDRLTPQERDMILGLIEDAKPATSSLLLSFGESVRNRREHEHPQWEDFYCLNLSSYMGERMGPALRRLVDVEAENEQLRARVAELEAGLPVMQKALFKALDRVTELEAERHTTNDALADVTIAQRAAEDRPVDEDPIGYALTEKAEASADKLTQLLAPTQALREDDDPARCLEAHPFSPRDGWRLICGSCDHSERARCHRPESGGAS